MRLAYVLATLLAAVAIGCGDGDETAPPAPSPCAPPSRLVGDRCLEPGVADDGCPAGTLGLPDGSCRPAGMLAEDCAQGFVHVPFEEQIEGASFVAGSCEPMLPADPCPPGQMAVPGEAACRRVMDCGSGQWGDIPVDAATVYVDQSFAGMSDGSAAAPWTSIGQAVSAAPSGALIAIAAGSYAEDVLIIGKPLRLWGVCPEQVELVGTGAAPAALEILTGASGSEVRGLAVRGAATGVFLSGSEQVLFERLWLHGNAGRGISAESMFGPTSFSVRACLLEQNHELGVFIQGSEASVEATVVRGTLPYTGLSGRGIGIQPNPVTSAPSLATVRACLLELNHEVGVFVAGSEATVEATVVRGTLPNAQGLYGRGIVIQPDPVTGAPSLATVRACLLEQSHDLGLIIEGSEASVEATVVRDTLPDARGFFGRGIGIEPNPVTGAPSLATVRACLLEHSHEVGVVVAGSETTVEATVVRGTLLDAQGFLGRGIDIQPHQGTGAPSLATVRASLLEQNHEVGVFVSASEATVEATVVRATLPNGAGLLGDGLLAVVGEPVPLPTHAFVAATRIDDSARAGVSNFGASVSLGATAIGCAAFELDGEPYLGTGFVFEDRGGNACGCPEPSGACVAVSTGLEPPAPVAPIE